MLQRSWTWWTIFTYYLCQKKTTNNRNLVWERSSILMHIFALLFRYLLWMESRCLYKIILLSLEFGFFPFEVESLGGRVMWSRWVRQVALSDAPALTPAAAAATSPGLCVVLSVKMIVNLVWFKLRDLLTRHCTTESVFRFFKNTQNWEYWHEKVYYVKTKKSATNVTSREH